MNTIVLQSYSKESAPEWIHRCLESVRRWAEKQGYIRRIIGDELFDAVPDWYMTKTGKGPIAADYARLVAMQKILSESAVEQVIWLDADVYVLDQDMSLASQGSCAFGQEVWVQQEAKSLRTRKNVHNAVCLFKKHCVVLPFLAETVASIIRRADPDNIAPQMVGPKLLTALHSLYEFDLLPNVGAVSQEVARDISSRGGPALTMLLDKTPVPLQAVNLCSSLMDDAQGQKVLENIRLLAP